MGSCWGGGGGLGSLGFAGSQKITHPSKNLAFIPARAFSASSMVAYVTKPNPLDLPEILSVITFAAKKKKLPNYHEKRRYSNQESVKNSIDY